MPYREPSPPEPDKATIERRQLVKQLQLLSTIWLILAPFLGAAMLTSSWWIVTPAAAATIVAMGYTASTILQVKRYAEAEEHRVIGESLQPKSAHRPPRTAPSPKGLHSAASSGEAISAELAQKLAKLEADAAEHRRLIATMAESMASQQAHLVRLLEERDPDREPDAY